MSCHGRDWEVDRLAGRHEVAAGQLEEIAGRCVWALDSANFHGPAADRLRDAISHRRTVLQRNADELRQIASTLRHHASWMRQKHREEQRRH